MLRLLHCLSGRHRQRICHSLQCNPVFPRLTLSVVRHGDRRKPLRSKRLLETHPGFIFQPLPLDVDVISPFGWEIHTCGQARIWREAVRTVQRVLTLVALKGSDSTCLMRLGLNPGSIFAVLFCDPVDFEGGK